MIVSMLDFIAYISCSEDLVIRNISDAFLIDLSMDSQNQKMLSFEKQKGLYTTNGLAFESPL